MYKYILATLLNTIIFSQAMAGTKCFIGTEGNTILLQEGDCTQRHSPCSTFKIAISLMGFNENILIDETHPEWPYKEEYAAELDLWKQSYNPTTWLKNSCIWYSRVITKQLGMDKFKRYVTKFNYGNQDLSGDKGKNNGLTNAWLSSSLAISPKEQIVFLGKLITSKLPVSPKAQEQTRKILFVEKMPNSWELFGKTGSGYLLNEDGTRNLERGTGWYIGWLQKGDKKIVFAHYMESDFKEDPSSGKLAREIAKKKLLTLIE